MSGNNRNIFTRFTLKCSRKSVFSYAKKKMVIYCETYLFVSFFQFFQAYRPIIFIYFSSLENYSIFFPMASLVSKKCRPPTNFWTTFSIHFSTLYSLIHPHRHPLITFSHSERQFSVAWPPIFDTAVAEIDSKLLPLLIFCLLSLFFT